MSDTGGDKGNGPKTTGPLDEAAIRAIVQAEWGSLKEQLKKDEALRPYLQEKQKLEISRLATASQWLIASLLAVNLAGLVFAGDSVGLDGKSRNGVLLFFFVGVVLALFSGLFNRQSARWHVTEAKVALGGPRPKRRRGQRDFSDDEIATEQDDYDIAATIAAWLSFGAFLIASVWAGLELAGQID